MCGRADWITLYRPLALTSCISWKRLRGVVSMADHQIAPEL